MNIELRTTSTDPTHVQIGREIERLIRTGELKRGQRLPPTNLLLKQWRTNATAVQRAMEHLTAIGLVERRPGRGTFVCAETEKAVIGLLVGPHLLDESVHFFRALAQAIQNEIGGRDFRCLCYDQLTFGDERAIAETRTRLLHDIKHHRFKGLVLIGFGGVPHKEEFVRRDLPTVALGRIADAPTVAFDAYDFTRSAVEHLASQGRNRIAYLRTLGSPVHALQRDLEGLKEGLAARQIPFRPELVYDLKELRPKRDLSFERSGYARMHKIAEDWRATGQQPDGLIVTDDVLMRGVAQALVDCRIRVPEEMTVVTSANEGIDHLYAVPVARFVFPIPEIARELCQLLWLRMTGAPLPAPPILVKGKLLPPAR